MQQMFERRNRMPMNDLLELRYAGYIIEEVANVYERLCGRVCLTEIRTSQLIYSGELGLRGTSLVFQNLMNLAVAVIGVVVSFPVVEHILATELPRLLLIRLATLS